MGYAYYSQLAIISAVLASTACLAVILRFVARWRAKLYIGIDDWFAVLALLAYLGYMTANLRFFANGGGVEQKALLPLLVLEEALKTAYAVEILSGFPQTMARFSLLALYFRIFNVNRQFRIGVVIIAIINAAWIFSFVLALIFQCIPVRAAWDLSITHKKCIDFAAFVLWVEIPDSLLDFIIIALPINVLRTLQLSLRHKISLACIFVLGGFVGVVGLLRISITYHPEAFNSAANGEWLTIQLAFAVIGCCLPTYRAIIPRPILMRFGTQVASLLRLSRNSTSRTHIGRSSTPSGAEDRSSSPNSSFKRYYTLGDNELDELVLTEASGGERSSRRYVAGRDFQADAINVTKTVDVI